MKSTKDLSNIYRILNYITPEAYSLLPISEIELEETMYQNDLNQNHCFYIFQKEKLEYENTIRGEVFAKDLQRIYEQYSDFADLLIFTTVKTVFHTTTNEEATYSKLSSILKIEYPMVDKAFILSNVFSNNLPEEYQDGSAPVILFCQTYFEDGDETELEIINMSCQEKYDKGYAPCNIISNIIDFRDLSVEDTMKRFEQLHIERNNYVRTGRMPRILTFDSYKDTVLRETNSSINTMSKFSQTYDLLKTVFHMDIEEYYSITRLSHVYPSNAPRPHKSTLNCFYKDYQIQNLADILNQILSDYQDPNINDDESKFIANAAVILLLTDCAGLVQTLNKSSDENPELSDYLLFNKDCIDINIIRDYFNQPITDLYQCLQKTEHGAFYKMIFENIILPFLTHSVPSNMTPFCEITLGDVLVSISKNKNLSLFSKTYLLFYLLVEPFALIANENAMQKV